MSAHYLIDLFANPVSGARVIDVRNPPNLQSVINGSFIIRVPNGVQVVRPAGVTDLITQKYQGLLAANAGFTHITFDDLLDATHLSGGTGTVFGQRGTIALLPSGTTSSVSTPLASTPTQAFLTWEVFSVSDTDPYNDRFQRTYTEQPAIPSNIAVQVSFNNGSTYNAVNDSAVLNIPLASQGSNFIIQFTNASTGRLFIGSWAVVY